MITKENLNRSQQLLKKMKERKTDNKNEIKVPDDINKKLYELVDLSVEQFREYVKTSGLDFDWKNEEHSKNVFTFLKTTIVANFPKNISEIYTIKR